MSNQTQVRIEKMTPSLHFPEREKFLETMSELWELNNRSIKKGGEVQLFTKIYRLQLSVLRNFKESAAKYNTEIAPEWLKTAYLKPRAKRLFDLHWSPFRDAYRRFEMTDATGHEQFLNAIQPLINEISKKFTEPEKDAYKRQVKSSLRRAYKDLNNDSEKESSGDKNHERYVLEGLFNEICMYHKSGRTLRE